MFQQWRKLSSLRNSEGTVFGTGGDDDKTLGSPPRRRLAVDDAPVNFHRWQTHRQWRSGTAAGVKVTPGPRPAVTLSRPIGTTDYTDPHTGITRTWEYGTWTSPFYELNFGATEVVPSWNARTPAGTWLAVETRVRYATGELSPWYVMARWASGDQDIRRTTVNGQGDRYSTVWTDTIAIDNRDVTRIRAYQIRLTLYREPGSRISPQVWMVGAMASDIPPRFTVEPSTGGIAWGIELNVPRRSQNIHIGEYPEYNGGGQAWCSPTSTTMVLEYWNRHPSEEDLAWVDPSYQDPQVDHAARMVFDYAYDGAGNWPFNTAYAATYHDMEGIVTRLHSLTELELFIRAGIPVVTSQSFLAEELDGAGYGTAGHLFVVIGFTRDGDVVVNDPASPSNEAVRHVYQREQFEQIWLRTQRYRADGSIGSGSGGIVYLIKPRQVPWPRVLDRVNPNW